MNKTIICLGIIFVLISTIAMAIPYNKPIKYGTPDHSEFMSINPASFNFNASITKVFRHNNQIYVEYRFDEYKLFQKSLAVRKQINHDYYLIDQGKTLEENRVLLVQQAIQKRTQVRLRINAIQSYITNNPPQIPNNDTGGYDEMGGSLN